ncbi:MAG: DEAD/DEAH box helicase [archaeon]
MESFRKLGLSEAMIKIIEHAKFTQPSEIQEKTIPSAMEGKDIIGGSATGSGKTLAFGASLIEKTEKGQGIQALVLVPTRELAEQVAEVLFTFSHHRKLSISMIYGGVGITPQIDELEQADIVVGTPGRLLDHMERGTIDLSKLKTLVLDEADRMLDMGFIEDVEKIISACPKERQTMLFSATISQDIEHLAKRYLKKDAVQVSVANQVDPTLLKQIYYDVEKEKKFSLLVHLLKKEASSLVMVFCNTRVNADFIANNLNKNGIESLAIHGGITQQKRDKILEHFKKQSVFVLVCTDLAARGLDIKNVSHVYNYDLPKNAKEYVHRIGRTARAGADGIAINIVSVRDYESFRNILRDDTLKIEEQKVPEDLAHVFIRFDQGSRRHDSRGRNAGYRDSRGGGRGSSRGRGSYSGRRY